MSKQFIVVTEAGLALFASPDPHEALAFARRDGSPVQWLAPSEAELAARAPLRMANPRGRRLEVYEPYPQETRPRFGGGSHALQMSSLVDVPESVMNMPLGKAIAAVYPIFKEANEAAVAATVASGASAKSGTVGMDTNKWTQPGGWLSVNAKLSKTNGYGVALGLALLPEWSAFRLKSVAEVSLKGVTAPRPAAVGKDLVGGLNVTRSGLVTSTFCVGSSDECRAGCLVNSGQNASAKRADYAKFAKAKALLERPYEFMRILGEACAKYERNTKITGGKAGIKKFLRLNVFSDIPWEEVAPWLFTRFSGLSFFDYTKVAGRPFVENYDLSFSYSGGNQDDCLSEYRRGRNIVQVYVAPEYVVKQNISRYSKDVAPAKIKKALAAVKGTQKSAGKEGDRAKEVAAKVWLAMNKLPTHAPIGGPGGPVVRVVDGDITDFRPMDPRGVIVGLRWKSPKVYDEETEKRAVPPFAELPKKFILYGTVVDTPDGPVFQLGETPSSSGADYEAKVEAARTARTEVIKLFAQSQWKVL